MKINKFKIIIVKIFSIGLMFLFVINASAHNTNQNGLVRGGENVGWSIDEAGINKGEELSSPLFMPASSISYRYHRHLRIIML